MKILFKLFGIALLASPLLPARSAPVVTKVSTGQFHTLFIESDGSLWGMGANDFGQLGLGFGVAQTLRPQQITTSNVTAVACGYRHSLFVEGDGSLWSMGSNFAGQLGDGSTNNHYFPESILSSGATSVAAGDYHSLFRKVTTSGRPFPLTTISRCAMGFNGAGQLGDGSTNNQVNPETVQATQFDFYGVTAMAGGFWHSLYVQLDGSLWAMGWNAYGQLGNGTTMDQHSPVEIETNGVIAVAAGTYHSLYLKSDGGLWAMGSDGNGQLGDNASGNKHSPEQVGVNVIAIAAGNEHSLFVKSDGSLWGMGANSWGQLGVGFSADQHLPVEIISSNVVAVAARGDHSFFIKSDGSLWAMGNNFNGLLGDGTLYARFTPVQVAPLVLPRPVITAIILARTNLVIRGTNGQGGRSYVTLTSPNMATAISQWTPVATNVLNGDGNFTLTATNVVKPNTRQQFYALQPQD